ncbi:MAG: single-stranded DNA-binding protein [Chloroflexi bacterium]|nr:single-stranded DNA-binding protein [Chloroflexota bacterium]
MSYQKVTVVGNLGRDPEMRYTPGGQAVTNFSVATNRQYTNSNGERIKETVWFRVSAWGRQAETCNQYLKTGSQVLVEGRMTPDKETGGPRVWTRQDGTPAASFELTAERVVFLSGRGDEAGAGGGAGAFQGGPADNDEMMSDDDEIPF